MGIYVYRRECRVMIEVSSRLLQSLTKKDKEKLPCFAVSILAFVRIACLLASIVRFVMVILLTGVTKLVLLPPAERVGQGGDSFGTRGISGKIIVKRSSAKLRRTNMERRDYQKQELEKPLKRRNQQHPSH